MKKLFNFITNFITEVVFEAKLKGGKCLSIRENKFLKIHARAEKYLR